MSLEDYKRKKPIWIMPDLEKASLHNLYELSHYTNIEIGKRLTKNWNIKLKESNTLKTRKK